MTAAIISFPGTNCDRDTLWAFDEAGAKCVLARHTERELPAKCDLVVVPGGFSYGDYLRCGAIAKVSPIMAAIRNFAAKGGRVFGICNGFQILLEAGLLPGAMVRNEKLRFISRDAFLKVENTKNPFLSKLKTGQILSLPIAHAEGNYAADADTVKELQDSEQILLTYCDKEGKAENINGSSAFIAGICNKARNVFALMPHPERACHKRHAGGIDGAAFIKSVLES
ncbi:MAG: phosphoribosylformylglycinamidine synthase subunit PurQ [Helicobacteraceae bacterium]|jgi:phosphoribosylformylglycinamidine synthase|nr:phosphoribosylformylglycinamidine synthase subunit PurQ [Helicobacteraceae bacterium]